MFEESLERSSDLEVLSVSVANGVYPASESDRDTNPGASIANYKVVARGDIVYNSMRMWQGAVDVSRYEGIVSPAYVVARPGSAVIPEFFARLLKRPGALKQYRYLSQGNSKDTLTLKYDGFSKVKVAVPLEVAEQGQIAYFFEAFDSLITLRQRERISGGAGDI